MRRCKGTVVLLRQMAPNRKVLLATSLKRSPGCVMVLCFNPATRQSHALSENMFVLVEWVIIRMEWYKLLDHDEAAGILTISAM